MTFQEFQDNWEPYNSDKLLFLAIVNLHLSGVSFCVAEILNGETGEEHLKLALDQLRDDQISESFIAHCCCNLLFPFHQLLLLSCLLFCDL